LRYSKSCSFGGGDGDLVVEAQPGARAQARTGTSSPGRRWPCAWGDPSPQRSRSARETPPSSWPKLLFHGVTVVSSGDPHVPVGISKPMARPLVAQEVHAGPQDRFDLLEVHPPLVTLGFLSSPWPEADQAQVFCCPPTIRPHARRPPQAGHQPPRAAHRGVKRVGLGRAAAGRGAAAPVTRARPPSPDSDPGQPGDALAAVVGEQPSRTGSPRA